MKNARAGKGAGLAGGNKNGSSGHIDLDRPAPPAQANLTPQDYAAPQASTNARALTLGVGRAALAERKDDLYQTPECAVRSLLEVEPLPQLIWEPACGPGAIVNVLRQAGHLVYATDLVDYGCLDSESRVDFLMEGAPAFHVGAILTNPPFKLADQFVRHALALGIPKVIMLLRLTFLESERRSAILDSGLLARIYVFRRRLPMMHRAGWSGPKASSAMAFAWFVWELAHRGRAELHRISWERAS